MTIYILLRRLAASTDVILLGRFYGAVPVGLYSRAQVLLMRPLDQFTAPFDTVFIPVLSRVQNQPERYRQMFLQVYGAIALLSFTFAGLLMALSQPLVLVLLGSRWTGVIPIFSWLTLASLYIPLSYAAVWLLTTQGRSKDLLAMGTVVPFIAVASVAIGIPFGVTGVARSLSLMGLLVRLPIQYHITGRAGPVSRSDLWGVFLKHLPLFATVWASTWFVQSLMSARSSLFQLLVGGTAGCFSAVALVWLWPALRHEALFILERARKLIRTQERPEPMPESSL
jgi:PST family polysaccharide transporter